MSGSDPWAEFRVADDVPQNDPWSEFRFPERSTGERVARAAGLFGAGFNERLAQTVGALPDLYNRGLRAVGFPALEPGAYTGAIQGGINAVVGEPPRPETTTEELARGAGAGLADVGTILVPAARVAQATAPLAGAAPSMTNRVAGVLAGQPVLQTAAGMTGGAVGEATDNPLLGTAAAIAVPVAAGVGGRIVTPIRSEPNQGRRALVEAAKREGIPVTIGQETGSKFLQNVEAALEQLPLSSVGQRAIRETQEEAFIRAAMSKAGVSASDTLPSTINAARDRIGGVIGEIANRNTLKYTPQLDAQLTQIEDNLRFLTKEIADPIRARIEQIRGMRVSASPAPGSIVAPGQAPLDVIPGASYRMLDSALGRSMRSTTNGDMRSALGDLRNTLRAAMDDSISPEDAAAWQQARRDYANLSVIARAAGRAGEGAAEGRMSPLALREAVNQSTGGGYGFGRGDLNELARIGQSVLRQPNDAGTAGRALASALLTGGSIGGGGTGATIGAMLGGPVGAGVGAAAGVASNLLMPRLAQALMNSDLGQAYLRNQLVRNQTIAPAALAGALTAPQYMQPSP